MKRKRFTEEQISLALRQAEAGTPVGLSRGVYIYEWIGVYFYDFTVVLSRLASVHGSKRLINQLVKKAPGRRTNPSPQQHQFTLQALFACC
jgi:hypothetical protein